jgi:quercetin dioxygenase-like cupin family protein
LVVSKPYRELRLSEDSTVREFSCDVTDQELEWHMDRRRRVVEILEGHGWRLQLQEGLPFELIPGAVHSIPQESWHRLLKGHDQLRILIREI